MTSQRDDATLARDLCEEVGRALLALRGRPDLRGPRLGRAGDRVAQEIIGERLAQQRPADLVLSEEAPDPTNRARARRVWIVDPLDGTREFAEPGRSDWAVHIALWQDGALVGGAVSLPAAGLTFATDVPPTVGRPGARPPTGFPGGTSTLAPYEEEELVVPRQPGSGTGRLMGAPAGPRPAEGLRVAISRSRPPAFAPGLAAALGAVLVPMGSAGVKAAAVWRGLADAYVHAGGQHEWDSAAPVAVARAAGLHASRLDGRPLEYNQPRPWLPDLLVCRRELVEPIVAWVLEHAPGVAS